PQQLALRIDHRIQQSRVTLRLLQTGRVRLQIHKLQGVRRGQITVERLIFTVIEQQRQPGSGVDPEVLAALRAHVQVVFQIFLPYDLPAALTLHPQAFGANRLLSRIVQIPRLALKPSHKSVLSSRLSVLSGTDRSPSPVLTEN